MKQKYQTIVSQSICIIERVGYRFNIEDPVFHARVIAVLLISCVGGVLIAVFSQHEAMQINVYGVSLLPIFVIGGIFVTACVGSWLYNVTEE